MIHWKKNNRSQKNKLVCRQEIGKKQKNSILAIKDKLSRITTISGVSAKI